jgi:hypothetical protein
MPIAFEKPWLNTAGKMSNKYEFSVPYFKPVVADSMFNSHIYNRAIARRRRHANCRSSGCVRRAVWRAPMTSNFCVGLF